MTSDDVRVRTTRNGNQPVPKEVARIAVEARWETPLVAESGSAATLLVRVRVPETGTAAHRVPLDVAFILDRSGSMRGDKLELAKEGVALATTRLRDADRLAVVVYDDAVTTLQPLAAATPRVKASLRMALLGVDAGGSTHLSGGWIAGCQHLAEAPPVDADGAKSRLRRAILLTDGLANVGMVDPRELSRHAGQVRQRGIATTTLGVGQDFDEGLLSAMAEAGGGNFQYAAGPEALRAFFAQELQELFNVVVTGLSIRLELPPGARADLLSAFPAHGHSDALDVDVGDVPAGDAIDLVFNVRVDGGALGDRLPFGVIASWTDPHADMRRVLDASPAPLRRVDARELETARRDPFVAERAALQRAAAERRAGLELDRAGRFVESRARMMQSEAFLMAAPLTDDVRSDLQEASMLAAAPASAAYTSHQRKTAQYREDQRRRGKLGRSKDVSS